MIVKGHVYDITPYVLIHPGGKKAILRFAGKDGSENVEFHSKKMMKLLNSYLYLGRLDTTAKDMCTIS